MIELRFDPAYVDEEMHGLDLDQTPAAAIEATCFITPTRFVAEGVDLLSETGIYDGWRPLPIIGFADSIEYASANLPQSGTARVSLADGGWLVLRLAGTKATVTNTATEATAELPLRELQQATAELVSRACAYARTMAPSITRHSGWASWCGGC